MEAITRKYSNGEVTVVWKPAICSYAANCYKELPEVFDPQKRPWVNPKGATTKKIIEQVNRCPSNALSYYRNDKEEEKTEPEKKNSSLKKGELC